MISGPPGAVRAVKRFPHWWISKKTFKNKNFEIISVNGFERGSVENAVNFVKKNKMDWVHVIDKNNTAYKISEDYKVQYIPTMYHQKR